MGKSDSLESYGEFKILKLQMPKLAVFSNPKATLKLQTHYNSTSSKTFVEETKVTQYLLIKKNITKKNSSNPSINNHNTLFVVNTPLDATEDHFKHLFKDFGNIKEIVWNKSKLPGWSVHIVFEDEESVDEILEMKNIKYKWESNNNIGLPAFLKSISYPNHSNLKEKVDEAMELFDEAEKLRKIELENRQLIDEDGFVLVTKKGKKNNMDGEGSTMGTLSKEDAEKLKPKEKRVVDFYRFQMREKKKNGKFITYTSPSVLSLHSWPSILITSNIL
ncbi:ribosomal RNA-processing protein 7-domain-containing protein [Globomyces pollinis-pini]|nr:ribosomal RNA-processing protein 7-domain-containing protein [Globomyces pollinis-pini]